MAIGYHPNQSDFLLLNQNCTFILCDFILSVQVVPLVKSKLFIWENVFNRGHAKVRHVSWVVVIIIRVFLLRQFSKNKPLVFQIVFLFYLKVNTIKGDLIHQYRYRTVSLFYFSFTHLTSQEVIRSKFTFALKFRSSRYCLPFTSFINSSFLWAFMEFSIICDMSRWARKKIPKYLLLKLCKHPENTDKILHLKLQE